MGTYVVRNFGVSLGFIDSFRLLDPLVHRGLNGGRNFMVWAESTLTQSIINLMEVL